MAREPTLDSAVLSSIRPDGSRARIHPADVRGRFARARHWVFAVLIAVYVATPFVRVGGHPAVHLDVEARRFFLFGKTFNAQDFWIVLLVATTLGFALLFATAWLGRVWCGWACPQTVFLEGVYRRIERWIDGPRERRMRKPERWTPAWVARASAKHGVYLGISWLLSHVALAFFVSIPTLAAMLREGPSSHPTAFAWAMVTTALLYGNYAWFREQLCVVLCPYGRLQSAMQDRDSLIVGYDPLRGEPRGRLIKGKENELGDCVDCRRCVQVCPTGIDIRNGLQMECIACAQCIDACDEVMVKLARPTGLIRYDSAAGLERKPRRVLRGRLLAYGGLLVASVLALGIALIGRAPFEANLSRMPGLPYVIEGERLRNQFELHLVNKNPVASTLTVSVSSRPGVEVTLPTAELRLGSLEADSVPIVVTAPTKDFRPFELSVIVRDGTSAQQRALQLRMVGPG